MTGARARGQRGEEVIFFAPSPCRTLAPSKKGKKIDGNSGGGLRGV